MQLIITPSGTVRYVYAETIDLAPLGQVTIARGSHVEPNAQGRWHADLSPVGGPRFGPFLCRSQALAAKVARLEEY